MKIFKKSTAIILAVLLFVGMIPTVSAADIEWVSTSEATTVVNYALSKVGTTYTSKMCQSFVWSCLYYSIGVNNKTNVGCCAKNAWDNYGVSTSSTNIPLGAAVYWSGSEVYCSSYHSSQLAGHVGIYVGDGYVVNNRSGSIHKDKITTINGWPTMKYLGWGWQGGHALATQKAISGRCGDNLTWTLDKASGKLTISGTGKMWDWESNVDIPWYSYIESIKSVNIGSGVTSIGSSAFEDCDSLTSITIPDSVTSIGDCAFYSSDVLTSITIPDSVMLIERNAFDSCRCLTSITVAADNPNYSSYNGVLFNKNETELIHYPEGKSGTSYTIPDSVTSIGSHAFYSCRSLESVSIGNSVESIGNVAFMSCHSLTSVRIPKSVTSIGQGAFYSCGNLSDVYYSGSKSDWNKITIDTYNSWLTDATLHTVELSSISIKTKPTKLEYNIGESFSSSGLTLTAKYSDNSTKTITSGFSCSGFSSTTAGTKTITVTYEGKTTTFTVYVNNPTSGKCGDNVAWSFDESSGTLTISGTGAMENFTAAANVPWYTNYHEKIKKINIVNGVTSIGNAAFYGCTNLESVTVPASIASIGEKAFMSCESLKTVYITDLTKWCGIDFYHHYSNPLYYANDLYLGGKLVTELVIPDGIKTVKSYAFHKCGSVESVSIPASVENIGDYVFYDCTSLSDVYYSGAKSDWDKITIGTDNSSLTSARLHTVEPKTLSSVSVKTKPTKLEYAIGESLNTAGLTLTATYSDNSTETVTSGFTCTGFSSTTAGTKTVTVTYNGKTATFTVTVKENTPAIGESDAAVYAPSIKALKGKTVSLDILIQNNPGINTVGVEVSFDKNVFTLKEMTPGAVFDPTTADGNIAKNPFVFSAYDAKGDKTENGTLFTLTFEVADGCADGDYTIGVNVIEAFNNAEKSVSFKSGSGKITVLSVEPGDVNGDGAVNRLDLTRLAKYFAGYEVEIVEAAADVTGDSMVNRLDLTRLAKYFAGYDVKLGE